MTITRNQGILQPCGKRNRVVSGRRRRGIFVFAGVESVGRRHVEDGIYRSAIDLFQDGGHLFPKDDIQALEI